MAVKFIEKIFSVTNTVIDLYDYKKITFLGISLKFRRDTEKRVKANYAAVLNKLKENPPKKIKVLFLVNEISKWKTQSLYDLMKNSPYFEPVIALTVADWQKYITNDEKQEILQNNYEYFKSLGMNCVYAYDFNKNKPVSLDKFDPQIVFYQQPWVIESCQNIPRVSKYALCCYVPYYVPNYGILSMDCKFFHTLLFRYYVLNDKWAEIYKDYLPDCAGEIIAAGHTTLDYFYLNKTKPSDGKNYVIYAPHWSICDEKNPNEENYATFDKNGKAILEYAKAHPDINWVFKPHPTLKSKLYLIGKMTPDEIESYYSEWEKIAVTCYDANYPELFRQSKALITDCGSFLVEYFATGKPLIHLISEANTTEPLEPSKEIFDTFYKVHDLNELNAALDKVVIHDIDDKKEGRETVLKNAHLPDNYAAQNVLNDLLKVLDIV